LKIADKTFLRIGTKRLSADVISFSAAQSSVKETLIDTVNNILSMKVDMVMRHANPGAAYFLSKM
jgi:aspartate carbamoyltransferase catalytic subunit